MYPLSRFRRFRNAVFPHFEVLVMMKCFLLVVPLLCFDWGMQPDGLYVVYEYEDFEVIGNLGIRFLMGMGVFLYGYRMFCRCVELQRPLCCT